jgi:hypothetical protein
VFLFHYFQQTAELATESINGLPIGGGNWEKAPFLQVSLSFFVQR